MNEERDFTIDCRTCIGVGTTACSDCVMTHLLANDDGPIAYVPIELTPMPVRLAPDAAAVALFQQAGLVAEQVEYVDHDEFERYGSLIH